MSNGELLERLLDMVKFGWIARLLKYSNIARYCLKLHKIAEYCLKLQNITQVLRARPTQGITHSTIAITLPLIVSRKGRLTQPTPSPLPLFYSL